MIQATEGCEKWRHDTQHKDAQHNDIQHNDIQNIGLFCDTALMTFSLKNIEHIMLSVAFYCYAECHPAECRWAECRSALKNVVMVSLRRNIQ